MALDAGLPVIPHAGEWPDGKFQTAKNVTFAIEELKAKRIGHGIAIGAHEDVLRKAKSEGVTVEVRRGVPSKDPF